VTFYHDTARNLLLYPVSPAALRVQHYIPEARPINGSLLAVPRTLRTSQVLRWLGLPVAPIITDENYDWPIEPGKRALPHQKVMANFEVLNPICFNLSDPGSMKTNAALWAADWLAKQHPPGKFRTLIVAPLSILDAVWANAIFRNFLGRRSFEILHGSSEKRRKLLAAKPDFAIVNFDGVGVDARVRTERRHMRITLDGFSRELADDKDIRFVIIDEADAYSDSQTKRHRIARMVFGDRPYLCAQTGTPTSQAPTDAYGMASLLGRVPHLPFTAFRNATMLKITNFKWVPQKDGYEKARRLLQPSIRYDIREVWQDAPAFTTQQRVVELTANQKKLLHDLKQDLQVVLANGKLVSAINEGAARNKFLQIVLGAVYDADHRYHETDAEPRVKEIEKIIEMTPRKVLIFVSFTSIVHILHKRLSKRWRCGIINGEVPARERATLIRDFEREEDFKVMIADPQPTAHGINEFVVADTAIWAGPTEKTRLYIQGNRRVHRPGQKWPTTVHQIVATKLEKDIFARLESNTSLQGLLLDAVRRGDL
jgi:SNF2 family DNA or RNA helicase